MPIGVMKLVRKIWVLLVKRAWLIGRIAAFAAAPMVAVVATPGLAATPLDTLVFHRIRVDKDGHVLPWASNDLGRAYDQVIRSVWKFWDTMVSDRNGLPYYMNHQVWTPRLDDHRGIGGDQIAMALSSWQLLYQYIGEVSNPRLNPYSRDRIVENMKFMADWVLSHGLSSSTGAWPNIPYPYNTLTYSGVYDGDMILGKDFTQPDKAGSFGFELVTLWKMTGNSRYLDAAIAIADTLAGKTAAGSADASPIPFKVNAETGAVGVLKERGDPKSAYTSNWTGTLKLWSELQRLSTVDARWVPARKLSAYKDAFGRMLEWMKRFPLATNKWGPFFEDVPGWSDTQINAVSFASYMMDNRDLFPDWKRQVRGVLDWAWKELGNREWEKYGVVVMNEQTAYRVPGNSHSSRQAAAELRYAELTGDNTQKGNAVRALSWATYSVDVDGKNRYPRDDVWMTDGYGDFVRHYLRAMAAAPELAPAGQDHILRSTSVVTRLQNSPGTLTYATFDEDATETLRLARKPARVRIGTGLVLREVNDLAPGPGWIWQPMAKGGVMRIRHQTNKDVVIEK